MYSHSHEVEMTRKYRKEHDLMGYEAEDLINTLDGLKEDDVAAFVYPDNRELEQVGVRGIYLNNFFRWDSRAQHEQMIKKLGYETALQNRTFDLYNDVDCWNYSDVHDYLKVLKHGYGKVVDHACREIRLRYMTRSEGICLVKKYQNRQMRHLPLFLSWLKITENAFHFIADQHRNPMFWKRNQKWEWENKVRCIKNFKKLKSPKNVLPIKILFSNFIKTPAKKSTDSKNRYVLFGKGYDH
jgi:hypothetical protein